MFWWGKIFGTLIGYLTYNVAGALLGFLVGHALDMLIGRMEHFHIDPEEQAKIQETFFRTVFTTLGHLAKADGRVSTNEIEWTTRLMEKLHLSDVQQDLARQYFREGKDPDLQLDVLLLEFKRVTRHRHQLVRVFMEIQIEMAMADGVLHLNEKNVLHQIAYQLDIDNFELEHLLNFVQAEFEFGRQYHYQQDAYSDQQGYYQDAGAQTRSQESELEVAYKLLGVSAQSSTAEIKRAYRKLVNEHHPDKLAAKGMPPEMAEMATQKTKEITSAYNIIKKARNI